MVVSFTALILSFAGRAGSHAQSQNSPQTKKEFVLLLIGLAILMALLYAMIIW